MGSDDERLEDHPNADSLRTKNGEKPSTRASAPKGDEDVQYPTGLAVAFIMTALWLTLFLVALASL